LVGLQICCRAGSPTLLGPSFALRKLDVAEITFVLIDEADVNYINSVCQSQSTKVTLIFIGQVDITSTDWLGVDES
jgi:hypothetical protein